MNSHTLPALAIYEQEIPRGRDWLDRLIARARKGAGTPPEHALVFGTVEPEYKVVNDGSEVVARLDDATFQPTGETPEGMVCTRLLYDGESWGRRA